MNIRSGQGLTGWVARNRRSLVNARPSADFEAAGVVGRPTVLQSALVSPLVFNERFIGTLAVYHTEQELYLDDHRRLLDRVCEQASAVINNSIIFEQTQSDSLTDPLTGLPNTRFMFMHLTRELARAERLKSEVARRRPHTRQEPIHMSTNRLMRRIGQVGVVFTAAGLAVLLGGGIASAHVTAKVIGEPATQGGFTKITFRVPNEDDTAGTVKLEVKVPPETPIASLRTKPVPGWTAVVTKGKLPKPIMNHDTEVTEGVTMITWTADAGVKIKPGEFGEFEVSGGPMPATDKLMLPAVQTYDNGKVVSWDAPPPAPGAEEPEHPAPVVALAPADAAEGAAAPANNAPATGGGDFGEGTNTTAATSTTDTTARWLGGIGLVVGALGLGFGAGATLRARRVVAAANEDSSS